MMNEGMKKVIAAVVSIVLIACMVMTGDQVAIGKINGMVYQEEAGVNRNTQTTSTQGEIRKQSGGEIEESQAEASTTKEEEAKEEGTKEEETKEEGTKEETKEEGTKEETKEEGTGEETKEEGTGEETKEEGTKEETKKDDANKEETKKDKKKKIKLGKPVLRIASRPNGKIKIKWNKTEGAAKYVLFRSTKKDGGFHKVFQTKKTYKYMDENRIVGCPYYYRLSAYTKGKTKRSDSKVTKGRSLDKVKLGSISNVSGSRKLVLQWKRVKGAEGYQIWRKNKAGEYKAIATVKGKKSSFTDKKRNGGKIYTYRVGALDANGGRGNLSESSSQMAIDANRKMIALTYDDGPCLNTIPVLDALEKYGARATFFVVGSSVNWYPDIIRREAALGCEIGNHTFSHKNLKTLSADQVRSAILDTNRVVKQQCGLDIHVMRPPGGDYNSAVCAEVGMPLIMWSVATQDWKTRSSAATIQCVKQESFDGAVVIMHDLHKSTADAADTVVGFLKSEGYQMVTISELAAYRGGMEAGKVYSQFRR